MPDPQPTPVYPPVPQPTPAPIPGPQPQPTPPVPQPVPATFTPQPLPPAAPTAPLPQLADQQATTVQVPPGGYASRFVRIPLQEFALPGVPEPWVEIRNPGMMAQEALDEIVAGFRAVRVGPDGEPDQTAVYQQLLHLIRSWCMWDARSDDDRPPMLPTNPTDIATLRRAPGGALLKVFTAFQELQNPQ
jgi:hypothetical protein